MLQKLQGGNTSPLHPAGLAPGGVFPRMREAAVYGKGHTNTVYGRCDTDGSRRRSRGNLFQDEKGLFS